MTIMIIMTVMVGCRGKRWGGGKEEEEEEDAEEEAEENRGEGEEQKWNGDDDNGGGGEDDGGDDDDNDGDGNDDFDETSVYWSHTYLVRWNGSQGVLHDGDVMVGVGRALDDEGRGEGNIQRGAVILDHRRADGDRVSDGQSGLSHGLRDVHLVGTLVGPGHLVLSTKYEEIACVDLGRHRK